MMSNNIGAQLRRFVSICQSEADSNSRLTHPLNRAPGEWQHLSELITSLLHTCPPARSAILSFVYPIVGAHLQSITQLQQQQQQMQVDNQTRQERRWLPPPNQPSENFILSILSAAGDVCNQESEVLNDLGQPSFAADVCTFALDLLVPLAPPPHRDVLMPTHCRRHQTSAHPTSRIPKVTSRRRRVNRSKGGLDSTDEMTECEDAGGSSSSSGGSGSSGRNSDSGSRNGSSSDDNESCSESVSEKDQAVIAVDVSLDLRPTGFNGRLLGATWMSSPVVRQLLRIVFSCILGKWSSQACLQSLVASSLPTAYRGRKAQQLAILQQTDPSACQPHWCTNWLLYQAATCAMPRQTIDKLCTRILDVCLRGPPLSLGVPYSPEYHRFWVLSGISNMLFFGPSVESHLASWLRDRLLHSSENHTPKPVFLHVIAPLLLIAPRSSSNNSASNNGEGTSQPPSHRNSPMSKRPAGFQESPNFGPVRPPVPPPPPPHPMQGPRWSFASHTPPGPRPPFCPPQPPLAPHPPPPPPQPSQNISAPPAAAPHRTAFEVASGLFPHDNLPPDSPQLRYLRSLCLSLRSVTLTVLKDFFSMPEVRLRPLLESYLMLIPDQEVELLRDVFVRGLFEAPAECSARWIELLLDLELSTDTSVSVGARSLLKLLCLRTHESIVCRTEVDSEAAGVGNIPFIDCLEGLSRGRSCQEPLFPGGGVLMRKLVTEGCLSAGQLLVLHLHHAHRRSLARALFGNLMLWNLASETANSPSPPKTRCPLLYFFPLLADWESIGGGGGGVNSLRDLLRDCVADVLDALANLPPKSQANALVNVLWLLRREQHLQGDPQLHLRPAMVSLLPRFIALLPCLLGDADLTVFRRLPRV
uniref:HECT domain-containing protein n=1 Tax=Mesocestoides corti TaxID=53468 RepID=A0A5K3F414_MESCO